MPAKERPHSRDSSALRGTTLRAEAQNLQRTSNTPSYAIAIQQARLAPGSLTPRGLLQVQRLCGNGVVDQMLAAGPQGSEAPRSALPIQAKLTVGPTGDAYEQEANRVAQQVVGRINAPVRPPTTRGQAVQRQDEEEVQMQADEEEVQMQADEEEVQMQADEEDLQMQPVAQPQILQRLPGGAGMQATPELESQISEARGTGQPLADDVRQPMERAFRSDFSGVRMHTGEKADALNRSLQARAFTTGKDIFFRSGEYNPGGSAGQQLLAHELAHTIQQGASTRIARWGGMGTQHSEITETAIGLLPPREKKWYLHPGVQSYIADFSLHMDDKDNSRTLSAEAVKFVWKSEVMKWKMSRRYRLMKKLGKARDFLFGLRTYSRGPTEKDKQAAKDWENLEGYVRDPSEMVNHAEGNMYKLGASEAAARAQTDARIDQWYKAAVGAAKVKPEPRWNDAFAMLGLALHVIEDIDAHGCGLAGKKPMGHDPHRFVKPPVPEATEWAHLYDPKAKFGDCDNKAINTDGYDRSVRKTRWWLWKFVHETAAANVPEGQEIPPPDVKYEDDSGWKLTRLLERAINEGRLPERLILQPAERRRLVRLLKGKKELVETSIPWKTYIEPEESVARGTHWALM